jgi:hypothetical protein
MVVPQKLHLEQRILKTSLDKLPELVTISGADAVSASAERERAGPQPKF